MHETSLARRILEMVLGRAAGMRVTAVRGSVAEDEALSADSLAFHFAAHAKGTPAEGARLELELRHVGARCNSCGIEFLPDHHLHLCPKCHSHDVVLSASVGVRIDTVDVEEP